MFFILCFRLLWRRKKKQTEKQSVISMTSNLNEPKSVMVENSIYNLDVEFDKKENQSGQSNWRVENAKQEIVENEIYNFDIK